MAQIGLYEFNADTIAERGMKFHIERRIAEGGFGEVFKATATVNGAKKHFALKRQLLKDSQNVKQYFDKQQRQIQGLRRESQVYLQPRFNNGKCLHLAVLFDVTFVTHHMLDLSIIKEPVLVMEWANAQPENTLSGWMQTFLVTHAVLVTDAVLKELLSMATQLFLGLAEMHSGARFVYVHQDLKPANILLFGQDPSGSGPFRLALTDFGLTVCCNQSEKQAVCGGGTRTFMAPEQFARIPARTPGRDIWAAGMILAELFAGASTKKALHKYRAFCCPASVVGKRHLSDAIDRFFHHGKNIADAVKQDGLQKPATLLSPAQQLLSPLLQKCFRVGCELEKALLVLDSNVRPTSRECVAELKTIWKKLIHQPWEEHYDNLPKPRSTPLQKLSARRLEAFYYEHVEGNMLTMMHQQSERLLGVVEPTDKPFVEGKIHELRNQLKGIRKKVLLLKEAETDSNNKAALEDS